MPPTPNPDPNPNPDPTPDPDPAPPPPARHPRRRPGRPDLDQIFGDVLPATTSDERDPEPTPPDPDDWYHQNRPPHHDR
ncbi:hypothetical protein [Actinophytocola sp.]|uniref:hypothetical protein n=1 Tax=Actinophytocola sp. TaxID=1872138 RepID=UPI0039C87254